MLSPSFPIRTPRLRWRPFETRDLDAYLAYAARPDVVRYLGMRREAHLVENERIKGAWTDEEVWAILQREWRARGAASDP